MIDILLIDIRNDGPKQLLSECVEQARTLIDASRKTLGFVSDLASHMVLPFADRLSRQWLAHTANPYLEEIDYMAHKLGTHGVYALNVCFEWGCTSAVYVKDGQPLLTRVMDWIFPKLGENIVVANQRGKAGEFYNVTWPGVSGVFQGMAPGRFAAALNQAPMRRHRLTYVGDWIRNRQMVFKAQGLPPAHLLRQVFEEAQDYQEARKRLCHTPVAIPVIYILSGVNTNEGCIIERTETDFAVRELQHGRVCTANHFETRLKDIGYGWRPRPIDSKGRAAKANTTLPEALDEQFSWFQAPIANTHTRLVMKANAADAKMAVFGTKGAKPVTNVFYK